MTVASRSAARRLAADFKALPVDRLERMHDGATEVISAMHALAADGLNSITALTDNVSVLEELQHYPNTDDVFDRFTGNQYYYHSHPVSERAKDEHGHFHLFGRNNYRGRSEHGRKQALTHLMGISVDAQGLPTWLFTTNRWVTGEHWLPASIVLAMLDAFRIKRNNPSPALHQWLRGLLLLFRPQIEVAMTMRDDRIRAAALKRPLHNVLEDHRTHVTSAIRISLFDQIEAIDQVLAV